jgi:MYXO-CTERM domain-containing protein
MLKTFKYTLCAAWIAASQLAAADVAEVKISNVSMGASQGQWWYWYPSGDTASGTAVELLSPSFSNAVTGAPGTAMNVSVTDGAAVALAQLSARNASLWDIMGVAGSASVNASGGQGGWAFTNVIDRSILVGGSHTTLTVSASLDSIKAIGPMSQANAYIEFCFNGNCDNYTEAFVDGTSGTYSGPSILTASFTSPEAGDAVWVNVRLGLTASVQSVSAPVPEPTTAALWLAGLAGVGAIVRRRRA